MHDIHLADRIIKICLEKEPIRPIKKVYIKLGSIVEHGTEVRPENLKFNLKMLSKGSNLAGAKFIIKSIKGDSFEVESIVV